MTERVDITTSKPWPQVAVLLAISTMLCWMLTWAPPWPTIVMCTVIGEVFSERAIRLLEGRR